MPKFRRTPGPRACSAVVIDDAGLIVNGGLFDHRGDGDRVVAIDGSAVHDLAEFYRLLWGSGAAGITVKLTVHRAGEQHEIGVKTIDRYRYLKLGRTY